VITVKIKGHPMRMLVDSGSDISYLSQDAYNAMDLADTAQVNGMYVTGLGGTAQINTAAEVDMVFGGVTLHDEVLPVSNQLVPEHQNKPLVDGVIGYDILQFFDIGLDLPDKRITFYTLKNCPAATTPWTGDFAPEPFTRPHNRSPVMPVTVDNQTFQLSIDSGAETSVISQAALTRMAVKPEAMAPKPETGLGVASETFNLRNMEFADVQIGAEDFSDDWVWVDTTPQADLDEDSNGSLDEDYLSTHKVFISNATATVYLGVPGQ
jgi:hypothetical protein